MATPTAAWAAAASAATALGLVGITRRAGSAGLLGLIGVIYPYNILQCLQARNVPALRGYLEGIKDGILGRTGERP